LTVLECTEGHRAAKLYHDPDTEPDPYDAGILFRVESLPIASLDDLAEALDGLRHDPRCMVIRGKLRADAVPNPKGLHLRRCVDRAGDVAAFEHAPHRHIMLDADNTKTPFDASDPTGSVEAWRGTLPVGLRTAGLVFQFSAKQHLSATVRGHAWFWLSEPLGDAPLRCWATRHGFDGSVFNPVQPHFTSDPIFPEGCADPLAPRDLVLLDGGAPELDITPAERAATTASAKRMGAIDLGEVGNPSDEPNAVKARARIVKQFAAEFERQGERWKLCGAIGGACAKLAIPPEECIAVLEDLGVGELPKPEAAFAWALGAYGLDDPKTATGLKVISDVMGPVTAGQVEGALRQLARATVPDPEVKAEPEDRWAGSITVWDLEIDPPPVAWVIPALEFGPGRSCMTVGYGGDGKTAISQQKAFDIALGRKLFGRFGVRQGKVLHLDYEAGGAHGGIVLENYARLCRGHGVDRHELKEALTVARANKSLTDRDAYDWLCWLTEGFTYCLLDAFIAACPGLDENSTKEIALPLYILEGVSAATGVTFDVVHHETKPTNGKTAEARFAIRGSSAIHGALSAAMTVRQVEGDPLLREVSCAKKPRQGFEPFGVRFVDVPDPAAAKGYGGQRAAGEASWGLRIEHAALDPAEDARDLQAAALAEQARRETVGRYADRIEGVLRGQTGAWGHQPMPITKVKTATTMNGTNFGEGLEECRRRGSVLQDRDGNTVTLSLVPERARTPAAAAYARAKVHGT
jgi:hypothetical protein